MIKTMLKGIIATTLLTLVVGLAGCGQVQNSQITEVPSESTQVREEEKEDGIYTVELKELLIGNVDQSVLKYDGIVYQSDIFIAEYRLYIVSDSDEKVAEEIRHAYEALESFLQSDDYIGIPICVAIMAEGVKEDADCYVAVIENIDYSYNYHGKRENNVVTKYVSYIEPHGINGNAKMYDPDKDYSINQESYWESYEVEQLNFDYFNIALNGEEDSFEYPPAEINVDYLDEVASIEITDVEEWKYRERMNITLTSEEVEALKDIKDCINPSPMPWDVKERYCDGCRMNLYDAQGNLITCWYNDLLFKIVDDSGQFLSLDAELEEWMEAIVKSHDLYSAIYSRAPGLKYFSELENAETGKGIENYLPNGSNDYIRFDMDEEDISSLRELADKMTVTGEAQLSINEMEHEYDNIRYHLSVYTNTEVCYDFYITDEGCVYIQTEGSYQVVGEGVAEWFRNLEAKYGLDRID